MALELRYPPLAAKLTRILTAIHMLPREKQIKPSKSIRSVAVALRSIWRG